MSLFDEIKQRCDKTTPGPWSWDYVWGKHKPEEIMIMDGINKTLSSSCAYSEIGISKKDDAAFIAHARTDVPLLLKALELVAFDIKTVFMDEGLASKALRDEVISEYLEQAQLELEK